MNFILTSFGSGGDVYPFIWMGKLLRQRGHSVTLMASAIFRVPAERAGLVFVPMSTEEEYLRIIADPDMWHPKKGPEIIFERAGQGIRHYYDAIAALRPARDTVLVASTLSFGSRLAREKFGLRMITVHLQPCTFLSAHDMPVLAPKMEWIRRLPLFLKKLFFRLPNPFDKKIMPYLREACRREGVAAPKSVLGHWWNSPDGVIGLFPDWFAAPQPDWPDRALLAGFPLYDLGDQSELNRELETFLANGEKPVLFTAGTAMQHGHLFFEAAVEACRLAGWRALLVTRHSEHLPSRLPDTALHCPYLPFSQILPRCSALVSHGGIGTISQGLAAGVPQLLMPMAHDQPDNLNRLRRLGVADGLYPDRFTPDRVANRLGRLISDPQTQEACRIWAQRLRERDNADALMRYLENCG